jgi:YVTN family beta-propeller protein
VRWLTRSKRDLAPLGRVGSIAILFLLIAGGASASVTLPAVHDRLPTSDAERETVPQAVPAAQLPPRLAAAVPNSMDPVPLRSTGGARAEHPSLSTVPRTTSTVVLFNNSTVAGNFLAGDGLNPIDVAYDSANGMIYIVEEGTGILSRVDPTTDAVVGTIVLPGDPDGITFDPTNGELYIANGENGVNVVNPTLNRVVANISTSFETWGVAYDGGTNQIFATDFEDGNVSVISVATNSVIATIPVGAYPTGATYDPAQGEVFIADSSSSTPGVSVINDTTETVVATVSLGNFPEYVLFDPLTDDVYVTNVDTVTVLSGTTNSIVVNFTLDGSGNGFVFDSGRGEVFMSVSDGNLTVFDASANTLVGNISVGPPGTTGLGKLAYDGAAGEIIVTGDTFTVYVFSDSNNSRIATITVGFSPYATAFDSARSELFVTSWQYTNDVAVVSTTSDRLITYINVGSSTVDAVYDSGRGEIFIGSEFGVSVINDTNNSVVATIPVGVSDEGLAYDPAQGEVFAVGGFGNGVSVINDTSNTITATSTDVFDPLAIAYNSGLDQLFVGTYGYANVSGDNVTVLNATTLAFVTNITLAGSAVLLGYDSGTGEVFAATEGGNVLDVTVMSDRSDSEIANMHLGELVGGLAYDPLQGEEFVTDLAIGDGHISANVTVISDATNSIMAVVPTGTEPAGASFDGATDQVYVANYEQGTLSIISQVPAYTATFTESGLPGGTAWSVELNGTTQSSSGPSITFDVQNGTDPFTVTPVAGFSASPASGSVVINGDFPTTTIAFAPSSSTGAPPAKYSVTFTESGLSTGTRWMVELNGTAASSLTSSLVFSEPNGTETFTVGAVSGYMDTPQTGALLVAGTPVTQSIQFAANASTSPNKNGSSASNPGGLLGLPGAEGYLLIVLIVALLLIVAAIALRSRHKGGTPPAPSAPSGESPPPPSDPGQIPRSP